MAFSTKGLLFIVQVIFVTQEFKSPMGKKCHHRYNCFNGRVYENVINGPNIGGNITRIIFTKKVKNAQIALYLLFLLAHRAR